MSSFSNYFVTQIDEDLRWRETELAILRKELISSTPGTEKHTTFLRTNLTMIYAHYEGFCKFALGIYIDALEKGKHRRDLKWGVASNSMRNFFQELKNENSDEEFFTKILTNFEKHLDSPPKFDRPDNIANLWPDLLKSWLERLGLTTNNIDIEGKKLSSLVNNRNQIAHGKKLTIASMKELEDHANAALLAMHEVAIEIAYALENQRHLRKSQVMTIIGHAT